MILFSKSNLIVNAFATGSVASMETATLVTVSETLVQNMTWSTAPHVYSIQ